MKLKYNLYFIFIIASGLVYSYTTTAVAQSILENKLIILALSAIIEMLIFFDLQKINIISRISIRSFFYLGVLSCLFIYFFSLFITNTYIYVVFYFFINIVISIIILIFENEILTDELNIKNGFLNLASVRNLSKIVGFGLGAILINIPSYYFIFLIILIFSSPLMFIGEKIILSKPIEKRKNNSQFKNLSKKEYFVILGILGTTTTIWIPIFVNNFIKEDMKGLSFIPFILPGIFIFLILELAKKKIFDGVLKKATLIYLILSILFMFYIIYLKNVWLGIFIFSLLTSVGILVSVELRQTFLLSNSKIDSKFVLQSLYLNGSIFLLIFSSVYKYVDVLQFVIIIMNILSMIYLLRERYKSKVLDISY